jgi:hypothetical protein
MYAVEFEAPIKDGVVHIPKEYQELQQASKAKFVVMMEEKKEDIKSDDIQFELEEFRRLREQSQNKTVATMDIVTNIDGLVDDAVF